jgi:pyruvate-formate lyase
LPRLVEAAKGEYLDFDDVIDKFEGTMDCLADVYVNAMNIIHYMHDKYAYERLKWRFTITHRCEQWPSAWRACQ